MTLLRTLVMLAGVMFIYPASADLKSVSLPSLIDDAPVSLDHYKGSMLLLSFFEPDCSWCFRQMKAFREMQQQCSSKLQPISIGVHGNHEQLRYELRRAKVNYPAASATPELLKLLGEIPATPWTVVFDPEGRPLGKVQGYLPINQIKKLFPEYCG